MFAEPKLVAFCAARCLGIDFCSPRVLDATIGSVGHDHHVRRIFLGQWRVQLVCSGAPYPEKERWGWLLFSGIVGILTGVVVLVAPWVATIVLASFYGLAWASGRFSPVCWRYPPPFGCVGKSRVKSGLPSVDCSRLYLALSSCGYFYPSGRVIRGLQAGCWVSMRQSMASRFCSLVGVFAKRAWGKSVPNQNLWI